MIQKPSRIGTESASIEPALTLWTDSQVKRPVRVFVVGATYARPTTIDTVSRAIHPSDRPIGEIRPVRSAAG